MKASSTFALVIMGLATWFVFVSAPGYAQTSANGPYYATPAWDQQLPASTRFITLSNWVDTTFPSGGAAVLDRETGLVWERLIPLAGQNWHAANLDCIDRKTGNRRGWRLPSVQELLSLIDPSQVNTALPSGHPFQFAPMALAFSFWSGTAVSTNLNTAWQVSMNSGSAQAASKISDPGQRWCVRGGQGSDAQ